jgi:hypothetical protein
MKALIQQPIIPGAEVGEYDPRDTLILTERIRKKIDQVRAIRDQILGKESGFFDDQELIIMALDRLPVWYRELHEKQKKGGGLIP